MSCITKVMAACAKASVRRSWPSARKTCRSQFFRTRQSFVCRRMATRQSSWSAREQALRRLARICRNEKQSERKEETGSFSDRRKRAISSSLKAHPEQVHFTIDVVHYESHGRMRKGVCSSFLAERAENVPIPVFPNTSK